MDVVINIAIAVFILVSLSETIYYGLRVYKSYKGIIKSLHEVSDGLESLVLLSDEDSEDSEDSEFLVQSADEIFLNHPVLNDTWQNFKKRLSKDKKYALVNPKEFFSRDKLINLNTKNRDRIRALPGLLTAWGLLGTFVAILMGLRGIDPNNIATINHLVHGLYAKFSSSIVALFCSIAFVFYERGLYSKVNIGCNNLQNVLEELFPTISGNEILSNLEMKMQAQANTMSTLSQSLAQNSLESIEKMVDMFRNTLTEGTAEQFRDISNMVTNLASMMKDLHDSQESFMGRMDAMNKQSETCIEQHKDLLKSINDALSEIDKKVEIFKNVIDKSKETYESLSDITDKIALIGEQFASVVPSIDENNNSIKQLTTNLNQGVSYFNNVTNEISNAKLDELIHVFSDGIKESLTDIQNGLNEDLSIIKEGYEWHDKQLNKLIETATDNIEKIHSSMNDYTEKTSNFLASYDESIAKAISYLNTNVHTMDNSLKDNIKTLENNFTDLNKTLESVNNQMNHGV